jgi:hypothetical protein
MKSQDGKRSGSKFRVNKYDTAHGDGENGGKMPGKDGGERAQANKLEARPSMKGSYPEPSSKQATGMGGEERMEEQVHPGIHDEVKQLAQQHGPAMETHITHDHVNNIHHLHTVHPDGHQHHSDHGSAEEAHMGAANAAGAMIPEPEGDETGNYPQKHKQATADGDQDDYEAEPLD